MCSDASIFLVPELLILFISSCDTQNKDNSWRKHLHQCIINSDFYTDNRRHQRRPFVNRVEYSGLTRLTAYLIQIKLFKWLFWPDYDQFPATFLVFWRLKVLVFGCNFSKILLVCRLQRTDGINTLTGSHNTWRTLFAQVHLVQISNKLRASKQQLLPDFQTAL